MKKILFVALAVWGLSACNSGPEFKVEGEISGADGKMLYLEASALEGIVPLDSVKLKSDGTFAFKQACPVSPEFYRLRVDDKVINFSIDSAETVRFNAPYTDFMGLHTLNQRIYIGLKLHLLQCKFFYLHTVCRTFYCISRRKIRTDVFEDSLATLMKDYKDEVKINYIFAAPNTAAAYFALFQKLNNYLIFDPLNNKDDVKCFAAVATSLNNYYPHADRSKNLYNIVIKGMKNTRAPQQKVVELPTEAVSETGIIDINLRDMKGNMHKLSDLKGKAVILDFTIYQSAVSPTHNYMLRDLYDKYAGQGLEIYQVSLDADEHYWKTTADNLPWICVRDANGVYSSIAAAYNVQSLPAVFLINKKSELSARGETIKDLDAAVKALL